MLRDELHAVREEFSDKRRTEIVAVGAEINEEDLIPSEEVVVTISHDGYVKSRHWLSIKRSVVEEEENHRVM